MAHKGRGHRLDIIRVTAVHMIKVHPPRDGRASERTGTGTGKKTRTEGEEGRLAGSFGSRPNHQKNGKAVVYNHSHPLWTICDELPICNGPIPPVGCQIFASSAPARNLAFKISDLFDAATSQAISVCEDNM